MHLTKRCPKCGTMIPNRARLCYVCKTVLVPFPMDASVTENRTFCPWCMHSISRFAVVCPYCGMKPFGGG